ncbi:FxsA family protein [Thioalkalivibrio paradoxus]|uniref:Exlusion protein FxsA n=1 Tax=Thioalkalivibrio paradoxus ARh 1 TaxID=713585 RepID=W0DLD8_9GAMM|nr:FxsA family protein [Thioalkalivibrio paradoxus]AHE99414.1 exlusion protein FxsA [Thioalkalivibrio paradoxus ARh 1]
MVHPLLPLFVFLGAVLLEIFGFAWVGGAVGALATVALVVITAAIGLWIFRLQGVAHWQRMQQMLQRGELPALGLLEGWLLMLAAVLLVVPGFFSDAAGFLLLVPPLRAALATWLLKRRSVWVAAARRGGPDASDTIEGEYRQRQDDDTGRLDDHRDR